MWIAVVLWLIWILVGTIFYAIRNELGWAKGFFMSINVGYGVGWGYPVEKDHLCIIFSIFYLLVGASAVTTLLVYFVELMVVSKTSWHLQAMQNVFLEQKHPAIRFIIMNKSSLQLIGACLLLIAIMTIWSCRTFDWTFSEGLYYAISSCSTGGFYPIPSSSSDRDFVIGYSLVSFLHSILFIYCCDSSFSSLSCLIHCVRSTTHRYSHGSSCLHDHGTSIRSQCRDSIRSTHSHRAQHHDQARPGRRGRVHRQVRVHSSVCSSTGSIESRVDQ